MVVSILVVDDGADVAPCCFGSVLGRPIIAKQGRLPCPPGRYMAMVAALSDIDTARLMRATTIAGAMK